jgi:uncharacterized damage-inducible protein DinB
MLNQPIISELKQEGAQTKKILERVPFDQCQWKPHEKSMTLGRLATHITELPKWITRCINSEELDLTSGALKANVLNSKEELLQELDNNLKEAILLLETASDEKLMEKWTFRNGEHVIFSMPRIAVIRTVAINHLIHHRGQLSVFLRLLDVPVPGMYGPSRDEY